jgi:predicted nucleic acid-binding protein
VILVDSSIWIDHIRAPDALLVDMAANERITSHPFIIGELALGHIRDRRTFPSMLRRLPALPVARDDEVSALIEREHLYGTGIGYIDAHLLASTRLTAGASIWTRDKRLGEAAARLKVAAKVMQ